jgi:hypothetical protein
MSPFKPRTQFWIDRGAGLTAIMAGRIDLAAPVGFRTAWSVIRQTGENQTPRRRISAAEAAKEDGK